MSPYKPIETLFKEPIMTTIDLAAARLRYDQCVYQGAPWQERDAALANLNAARIAAETPRERIARLHREAADLDAQAERFMVEEASLAGRIAYCLQVPEGRTEPRNPEQAFMLEGQMAAVLRCAQSAQDAAWGLKLEASGIMAELDLLAHLVGTVRSIGGRS